MKELQSDRLPGPSACPCGHSLDRQRQNRAGSRHPDSSESSGRLDALPSDYLTFIMSERGKPMIPEGCTNWFRKLVELVVDDQGYGLLPDGPLHHGLPKATCRRLAEAGCSAHEIIAISGHQTVTEVTRYTVAANRVHLAERAVAAMERKQARTYTVKPTLKSYKFAPYGFDSTGQNRNGGRPWNRTRRGSPRGSYSPLPHLAARRPPRVGLLKGAGGVKGRSCVS